MNPKPWNKPQPGDDGQNNDAGNTAGNIVEGAGEIVGGAMDAVGSIAGGSLEAAGGCAEGCGGCSAAILIALFATAGTAMACFG